MNVIISNKYQASLLNLNIDILKSITGEFSADDIINEFNNFFFNKMIIDITALKDAEDIATMQKLSVAFDTTKLIFLLDDSAKINSSKYLSQLVSIGIYNFTTNVDAIPFLISNPNKYQDVMQYHQLNNNFTEDKRINKGSAPVDTGIKETRIIGFKNITEHAGATTLIYMLKKQLDINYNVLAIELDKNDFAYLNDPDLKSMGYSDLATFLVNTKDYDAILIDINYTQAEMQCTDMVNIIEPGTIKLNKMIRNNKHIFENLKGKKIILNQSLLDNGDVKDFEFEAKSRIFANIPPLDDKKNRHLVLDEFLVALGFSRQTENGENKYERKELHVSDDKPAVNNGKLFGIEKI